VNPNEVVNSDGEVIARSRRSPELFAEVFDRHHRAVHAYAARRAGADAADDVLAEVFLVAFKQRKRFDPDSGSALPWLYGIAANVLRRRWRTLAATDRLVTSVALVAVSAVASHEERVATEVDAAREWLVVRQLVAELADGDREAIMLFAWEELTYPQIAEAMGIPVGTVRSRIHRARATLRASLGEITEVGS
jgi:RNA polymerase sigma-70 factor (ECF subfamily)